MARISGGRGAGYSPGRMDGITLSGVVAAVYIAASIAVVAVGKQ
jgi:hypothetical protein